MKYVFIAYDCYPFPLAKHLIDEGHEVIVGQVAHYNQLMVPGVKGSETRQEHDRRMSIYNGMLNKRPLNEVVARLRNVPASKRDDYFFFFDYGDMYKISEAIMRMGFRNGLFPTEYYFNMEKDRKKSKDFVKKNYKTVKVADAREFKKIEDGIDFLKDADEPYVLKSNGSFGRTVVPAFDDVDICNKFVIDALKKNRSGYEMKGFTLEAKIVNCLELTPVLVCYNGKPVYSLVEFENKEYGAGNIGIQKGGNQALSVRTPLDCELNKIAFPEVIYGMAKKQPGLSIYDAGFLYDGKDFWFTEFCAMRYGWDGILSEIVMRDEGKPFVNDYFEDIVNGKSPLKNKFGASVRLFNLEGSQEITDKPEDNMPIMWDGEVDNNLFAYRVKKGSRGITCVGGQDLLGAMTAAGDDLKETVSLLYDRVHKFYFEKLYYRPEFDFMATEYKTSIPNRLKAVKSFMGEE